MKVISSLLPRWKPLQLATMRRMAKSDGEQRDKHDRSFSPVSAGFGYEQNWVPYGLRQSGCAAAAAWKFLPRA